MIDSLPRLTRYQRAGVLFALLISFGAAACGAKKDALPSDPAQADKFLLDHGKEALAKKKWMDAREYFRKVVDNYPNSGYRAEAKGNATAQGPLPPNAPSHRRIAAARRPG